MTRNDTARWFAKQNNICILTHSGPDGDTLGSAATLCLGLRSLGKNAVVLENPETPKHLFYLCEGVTAALPMDNAVFVSVDVAAPHMLPLIQQQYLPRLSLRIDHHGSSTPFGEQELVDPKAASCAEIVYDILMEMGVTLTADMAIPLYTGISTDTGCFRYANTTAHTFSVAAACAATGANLQPLTQMLFDTVSLNKLKVQAWVTEHIRFLADGKAALCALPDGLAKELDVEESDVGGMSGFVRSIEGVCIAVTLRDNKEEGLVFLSARAVPGYDAAAVCEKFGGGGHKGAAGGSTKLPLADAVKAVETALLEAVKEM